MRAVREAEVEAEEAKTEKEAHEEELPQVVLLDERTHERDEAREVHEEREERVVPEQPPQQLLRAPDTHSGHASRVFISVHERSLVFMSQH